MTNLQERENIWKMAFNLSKCKVIRITQKRVLVNTTYLIHNHPLQLVKQGKYLGVILSDKLVWTPYIPMVTKTAKSTLAFLRRTISRCPRDVKARCYESLIRPNLEYASSAGDTYTMGSIQQLEAVQRPFCQWTRLPDTHPTIRVSAFWSPRNLTSS